MTKRSRFIVLFIAALVMFPLGHTEAGDDLCPSAQYSCIRTCQTNYNRCAEGCWRANPNNELAYEQCEYRCSISKWNCEEGCQSTWGCYEAF